MRDVELGRGDRSARRPSWRWSSIAGVAAFAVVIMALCAASIQVPRALGWAAPLWPANAVILAVVLASSGGRRLAWLASGWAGVFAANLLTGSPLDLALIFSSCNVLEVTLAWLLLRRFVGESPDPSRIGDLLRIFVIAGAAAPLAAATLASLALGRLGGEGAALRVLTWAAGDGLGAMVIVPLLLSMRDLRGQLRLTPMRLAAWAKLAALAAVTALVLYAQQPFYFLVLPALLLAIFELEMLGASLGLLIIVVVTVAMSAVGFGAEPHMQLPLGESLLAAQLFLATMTLAGFPTAAVLAQRRRLKIELQEQFRRVKLAEEVAGVGYWRIATGSKRVEWSDAMFATYGLPAGGAVTLEVAKAGIHPEDHADIESLLQQAMATREDQTLQARVVRPDGEIRHILAKASCELGANGVPAALFGTMLDVTELRRAENELVEREARYRMLADAATDVVLKIDRGDVILYASPSVRRYGYEPEDLVGRTGFSLVHPEDLPKLQAIIADLFASPDVDSTRDRTYRVRTADGGYVWMEGNPATIPGEDGQPVAVVSQLRDITRRMALEADLLAAREAAEAAAAVKGEFLANMSHELRTPLTSVLGFTRLALEQPELAEATRGYISKASTAGAALLTTVNDILDFSKLESGQLQIRPEACDAETVCRDTLELFSAGAEAKGVSLRFEASDLPARVMFDASRLRQILLNLVGNAVKFSDGGEVRLSVGWRAGDQRLLVAVQDDGPGIAPEQQGLLFRRFSQIDGSATRRHEGTGLGLAICRGLVEAMGGTIGMESELGKGSRFFFEAPAQPCAAEDAANAVEQLSIRPGVRVLVADDHRFNRELVRAVLTPLGAEVVEAADGAQAVAAAEQSAFDIILMDLRMPGVEGHEAMRRIRAGDGPNRNAPILAFSAGADEPGAEDRRNAGFDGDLAKPVLPANLITAVSLYVRDAPDPAAVADMASGAA